MYKSIDLFAGIGGIRLGFDQAFESNIKIFFNKNHQLAKIDLKAMSNEIIKLFITKNQGDFKIDYLKYI